MAQHPQKKIPPHCKKSSREYTELTLVLKFHRWCFSVLLEISLTHVFRDYRDIVKPELWQAEKFCALHVGNFEGEQARKGAPVLEDGRIVTRKVMNTNPPLPQVF